MSQGKQTKQQKNGRSSIPTAFQPKLFTLYPLQAFATCDRAKGFLRDQATLAVMGLRIAVS